MRMPLVNFIGRAAFVLPALLLGIDQSRATEWQFADGGNARTYTVSSETPAEFGEIVSIRYQCKTADRQKLQIAIPSEIFDSKFKTARKVGIAWKSDKTTKFPGSTYYEQTKVERTSDGQPKVLLSFENNGAKVLESAHILAESHQAVVIQLFELGRRTPIVANEILLEFKIPVEGSTKAFGEAFSRCEFAY